MTVLPLACRIARKFQAHLIGIHTLEAIVPYPGIALHIDHPHYEAFNEYVKAQNAQLEKLFRDKVGDEDFTSEWRSLPTHSVRASDQLIQSAFRSDLVIAAQPDRERERFDQLGAQKDLIIDSGRPVLLVPQGYGDVEIGARILLAWNATKEASVAAHSALPFMIPSDEVTILTVAAPRPHSIDTSEEGHEVARLLSRHGVRAEVRHVSQSEESVGAQVLQEARSGNHDLIVMGAFGHSRMHSFFFSDATQFMLKEAELPVLYAS